MKLSTLVFFLFAFAISASSQNKSTQDSSQKTQPTKKTDPAETPPSKEVSTPNNSPMMNRIAVSDPGMPAEKDTTSKSRREPTKPREKKKNITTKPK